ncbi:MAG: cyclic nucleotide-binding domain-containing protein [Deltaproteobacteria bacterium]|nr:cyclic nucleotide-binding domain-containing protein [Deltaproteobacteria bacterium]
MDVFAFLKANPLLRGFTDDGVRIIQSVAAARQLEPGMPIFVERMMGESLFMLAIGEVTLHVTRNGIEREIGTLYAPDSFGELSLLHPGPRRVTAKTRSPSMVIEIPRRDFARLQQQRPQACLKLVVNITEAFAQRSVAGAPLLERLVELL